MSMGFRADPTNTSGVITVAGVDQVVVTNASNVVATTFTGALAGNADTATKLATATGTAPSFGVRAWVNFDGTRDVSGASNGASTPRFMRANGNVASVLLVSNGLYTMTFAVAMPDENYAVAASQGAGNHYIFRTAEDVIARTASSVSFYTMNASFNFANPVWASVMILR